MAWGAKQITKQAYHAEEDYAAFEAIGLAAGHNLRVLDVGCFDGFNTVLKFAPYDSIAAVVGIDPSASDIEVAQARTCDKRFVFVCTDFESFPEQQRFDVIYMSHVLQHMRDPEKMVAKARRLLAPGGFFIVKTTDDAAKMSFPDPENLMDRLFALYEQHVLRATSWTHFTDRYFGQKCYTLLKAAGFKNVRVAHFMTDTAEKSRDERLELFERCVYFRRKVPAGVDACIADEIHDLIALWHDAFLQEDYYFSTSSYVIVGQNVALGCTPVPYQGAAFAAPVSVAAKAAKSMGEKVLGCGVTTGSCGADTEAGVQAEALVRPLCEHDLGRVMSIEIASFPDPWTPLAFAMEMRHNPQARYNAAVLPTGEVVGYSGVWHAPDGAHLLRIAVDTTQRGRGLGARLVDVACEQARIEGLNTMLLEVRANNEAALAFYQKLGFVVIETLEAYYTNPTEDALVLYRDMEE